MLLICLGRVCVVSIRTAMNSIHKGWFSELSTMWPGQCLSLEVDEVLYHEKSKYQDVMVLQTYVQSQLIVLLCIRQLMYISCHQNHYQCTTKHTSGYIAVV